MITVSLSLRSYNYMMIVIPIWQKLSSVKHRVSLIVTHIWPNPACIIKIYNLTLLIQDSIEPLW
jgi:hypothetical protein